MIDARARIVLAVGVLAIALILTLPPETAKQLAVESGSVENASLVLLGGSVVLSARELARRRALPWLSATLVTLAFLLRELDVHRMFGPRSIDSTGFHRSAAIPLQTKLLVIALAIPFLLAGLHVCGLGVRRAAAGIRARQAWIGHAGLALAMVAVARIAEKSGRDPTHVIEEVSEAMLAAFVLLLVLCARRGAADSAG